jgi:hypothetical protein
MLRVPTDFRSMRLVLLSFGYSISPFFDVNGKTVLFMDGSGIGSSISDPFYDTCGRKTVYRVSMTTFLLCS